MPTKQVSYTQGPGLALLRQALCPMRLGPNHHRHEDGSNDSPGVPYQTLGGPAWVVPEALVRDPATADTLIVTGYTDVEGHSGEVWSRGLIRPERGGKLTYGKKSWFEGFAYPNLHGDNPEPDHVWQRHFSREGLTGALTSPIIRTVEVDAGSGKVGILPLRLYRQRRTIVLEMLARCQDGSHVLMIFDFRSNSKEIPVYKVERS